MATSTPVIIAVVIILIMGLVFLIWLITEIFNLNLGKFFCRLFPTNSIIDALSGSICQKINIGLTSI